MERRLTVIMFADMADYTRLMGEDQPGTISLVQEVKTKWLEPETSSRGGKVVKRLGDGWIIEFKAVSDAVEAAQVAQNSLASHPKIKLRIAIHIGEIADDGTDLFGSSINIASRLQTEAPPGGIMISEDLYRQLDEQIASEFGDAGSFSLKNVAREISGYQWRPSARLTQTPDDVPAIAIANIQPTPEKRELLEAAADIQEQLIHRLSRRTGIRVLAVDSEKDARSAATYLFHGRLRVHDGMIRMSCLLCILQDGRVLWTETIEQETDDLFAFSDYAAKRIDNDLRLQINAFDGERISNLLDENLNPSELRTRAAHLFYSTTLSNFEHAIVLLERALRLDPENAMNNAMWAFSQSFHSEVMHEDLEPEIRAKMVDAADYAVQAAPRSDFVFKVRAEIRMRLGDIDGAQRDLDHMLRINPDYTIGYEVIGIVKLSAGDLDAALTALEACVQRSERDPYLPYRNYLLAVVQLIAGQVTEAIGTIEGAIEIRHDCWTFWRLLAEAHRRAGDPSEATTALETAAGLTERFDLQAPRLRFPPDTKELAAILTPTPPAAHG